MEEIAIEWVAIIPVFTFILGLLGKVFYDMWHDNYIENKNRQKDALKKHFADLEASVIKPMSEIMGGVTNSEGRLWIHSRDFYSAPKSKWLTKDFKADNFYIFKLHFPTLVEPMVKLMDDVDSHNEKFLSFCMKLEENIEEKTGLTFRVEGLPFVENNVPVYLQQTLYHLAVKKLGGNIIGTTYHDFREVEIKEKPDSFWVTTKGPGAVYAKVNTMDEATSFRDAMIELMESSQLQEEMCDLYLGAKQLEIKPRALARILDFTCDQYGKYGKLLKRKKDCPVCQVIYE